MRPNTLRHSCLLKTTAVFAAVVFSSTLVAEEVKSSSEAVTHVVEIQQFKFVPATVKIKSGDSIRWINRDIVPHTATAVDQSWDTGQILNNQSQTLAFSEDSFGPYFCFYHPSMKAGFEIIIDD